jgi:long-chain fatty acid transport protein
MSNLSRLEHRNCPSRFGRSPSEFRRAFGHSRQRWALAAFALAAGVAHASVAHAAGFLTDQFGADQGNPALANTYSVYFNPGAMAGVDGTEITGGGTLVLRTLDYTRDSSALTPISASLTDPVYVAANTGKSHAFTVAGAPYLGFVTDFGGSRFRVGAAGYVPFGGIVSFDKNTGYNPAVPGAYDGPQRWAATSATTLSLYGTAAVAYRLDKPRIGLGASVSIIHTSLSLALARNLDGSDDIAYEGRAYADVSGLQVGAAVGAYWDAMEDGKLRFGLSYTSQPNFGTMRLGGTYVLTSRAASIPTTQVDFLQSLPDVVRFGVAWRALPEWEFRLDGNWQRWSQLQYQCIVQTNKDCPVDSSGATTDTSGNVFLDVPRQYKDTLKLRLGAAYWIQPPTELWASASYESPPVGRNHIDPLLFDWLRFAGTLGVRHAFGDHLRASLSYTFTYIPDVTVTGSAYSTYTKPSRSPSMNGDYSSNLHFIDAAVSYRF